MKKIFFILIALFSCLYTYAQADRTNSVLVRINYNTNIYTSVKGKMKHNFTSGYAVDFGAKQFLKRGNGWFLEEEASVLCGFLPFVRNTPNEKAFNSGSYEFEFGTGITTVFGYDFKISNNKSLSLYVGPDFRYIFVYDPEKGFLDSSPTDKHRLHRKNLRLRVGTSLNINKLNLNLFLSPDLLDRGLGVQRYRTLQVGLGVGYHF